jgi:hypothetical protein
MGIPICSTSSVCHPSDTLQNNEEDHDRCRWMVTGVSKLRIRDGGKLIEQPGSVACEVVERSRTSGKHIVTRNKLATDSISFFRLI